MVVGSGRDPRHAGTLTLNRHRIGGHGGTSRPDACRATPEGAPEPRSVHVASAGHGVLLSVVKVQRLARMIRKWRTTRSCIVKSHSLRPSGWLSRQPMPELPEVEIVRRNLTQWVYGRTITNVASSGRHRGVVEDSLTSIVGCRIEAVSRLGKYLTLRVGLQLLVIHLGMSGRLLSHDPGAYVAGPHDQVRISTDDGRLVAFQDHRRFGRMFLSPLDLSALPPLGPDPLQTPLTPTRLAELLERRPGKLKSILMNQAVISGIGNIYACEILWAARLSPFRSGLSLGNSDYSRLAHSLADVLKRAIAARGSTLDDYRGTSGAMGNFDLSFSVYARGGMACPRCGSPIAAQTMAGRVTYWCPDCQS